MHQLFVDQFPAPGRSFWLGGEERHYLGRALRARPGERFRLAASDGSAARAELKGFNGDQAELLVEALDPDPEDALGLHLALCAPRGDALEQALDMAVQLGVRSIRLLRSERTLAAPGQGPLKPERLQKRLKEAARQCLRARLPALLDPLGFAEALALPPLGLGLILSERGGRPLRGLAEGAERLEFTLLVGPEGGFSAEELGLAQRHAWVAATLGPRPLRVPTAVAAAMAGLQALHSSTERT